MPIFINCFKYAGISEPNVEKIALQAEEKFLIEFANMLPIEEPECINEDIQICDFIDDENWEDTTENLHE